MKNMKLFPKTFLHCLGLMVGVVLLTFLLIYSFLPVFYRQYKQKEIDADTRYLAENLQGLSAQEASGEIVSFAIPKGYGYTATASDGEVFCSAGIGMSVSYMAGGAGIGDMTLQIDTEMAQSEAVFDLKDGGRASLCMEASLQPIDDAVLVLMNLFPVTLVLCVLLSAFVSWVYAKAIVRPIRDIADATARMSALEPDASCRLDRGDEIGLLAQNVNEMYQRLLETIAELEKRIDAVTKAEQEKLDFLLLASHELKTPVTAVRGMVEGMLYQVGVYKDRDTWLKECLQVLENLTKLICGILETSKIDAVMAAKNTVDTDVGGLLERVAADYLLVAQSRGQHMSVSVDSNFCACICAGLVEKALSNVLSNAVKYTDGGNAIRIYMKNRTVVIENECTPLSDEEMNHIGEPFFHPAGKSGTHTDSTGLGLYFTDRILSACGLSYTFAPYEEGMRFTLHF